MWQTWERTTGARAGRIVFLQPRRVHLPCCAARRGSWQPRPSATPLRPLPLRPGFLRTESLMGAAPSFALLRQGFEEAFLTSCNLTWPISLLKPDLVPGTEPSALSTRARAVERAALGCGPGHSGHVRRPFCSLGQGASEGSSQHIWGNVAETSLGRRWVKNHPAGTPACRDGRGSQKPGHHSEVPLMHPRRRCCAGRTAGQCWPPGLPGAERHCSRFQGHSRWAGLPPGDGYVSRFGGLAP